MPTDAGADTPAVDAMVGCAPPGGALYEIVVTERSGDCGTLEPVPVFLDRDENDGMCMRIPALRDLNCGVDVAVSCRFDTGTVVFEASLEQVSPGEWAGSALFTARNNAGEIDCVSMYDAIARPL